MGIIEEILEYRLEDLYHDQDKKVSGIAQLAIDKGYNSLSERQKKVLNPFLKIKCAGARMFDERTECNKTLQGQELLNAYEDKCMGDDILCKSCRSEKDEFDYMMARNS